MKIVIDTREQTPYQFTGKGYAGTVVEVGTLQTGDYSLHGLTAHIALERKSLDDLTGTRPRAGSGFNASASAGGGWSTSA